MPGWTRPSRPEWGGRFLAVHLAVQVGERRASTALPRGAQLAAVLAFAAIFVAARGFWPWGEVGRLVAGWPLWAWFFVALGVAQAGATWWWPRRSRLGLPVPDAAVDRLLDSSA
jgi:hypothetical protein